VEENDAEVVSQLGIFDGAVRPPNNAAERVHVDELSAVLNDFAPAHRIPLGRGQIHDHGPRRRSKIKELLIIV